MIRACTFFGHRDAPSEIQPLLTKAISDMIECHDVNTFYVGCEGQFDAMVHCALHSLQNSRPDIRSYIVLAKHPGRNSEDVSYPLDTLYPEGFEAFLPRFAIVGRNRWMLRQSNCVITYIRHSWGGAAQFAAQAERQGKTILRL